MRVSSSHISSHVSPPSSPPSPFIPFSLFSFSPPPLLYSLLDVKAFQFPQMEPLEDDDLQPLGSEHELDSTGSGVSSILGTEDARSTTSSGGDISVTSSSSGEYLAAVVAEAVVPRMENPTPASYSGGSGGETTVTVAAREKCVGRNNKGVTWGFTSVIGRRREMEDAVAVVPGFMSRTCDHIGGCTAPASRTSREISPVHFFGVYDGHGGSQVVRYLVQFNASYFWKKKLASYNLIKKLRLLLTRHDTFHNESGPIKYRNIVSEEFMARFFFQDTCHYSRRTHEAWSFCDGWGWWVSSQKHRHPPSAD